MGKMNDVLLSYLQTPERFADLFNGGYFQGQVIVKAEHLTEASEVYVERTERSKESNLGNQNMEITYRLRTRDLKKHLHTGTVLKVLAIENQSSVDYSMPLRCMGYDYLEYRRQLKELQNLNELEKNYSTDAEKLCKIKKTDYLFPTYTLCFYHGEDAWDGPRSLKDMMNFGEDEERMQEWFADYPMRLFCLNENNDFSHFHTSLREVFTMLQYRKDIKGLRQLLSENSSYQNLDEETLEVLSVLMGRNMIAQNKEQYKNDTGGYDMCKALDDLFEEGQALGLQKGQELGGAKQIIEMSHEFGLTTSDILQRLQTKLNISLNKANEYLVMYSVCPLLKQRKELHGENE